MSQDTIESIQGRYPPFDVAALENSYSQLTSQITMLEAQIDKIKNDREDVRRLISVCKERDDRLRSLEE